MGYFIFGFSFLIAIVVKEFPSYIPNFLFKLDLTAFNFFSENLVYHCANSVEYICNDNPEILFLSVVLTLILGGGNALICAVSALIFQNKLEIKDGFWFQISIFSIGVFTFSYLGFDLPDDNSFSTSNITKIRNLLGANWFYLNLFSSAISMLFFFHLLRFGFLRIQNWGGLRGDQD